MVIVTTGASRGMTGKVLEVFPETSRVLIEGVNMKKKYPKVAAGDKKKITALVEKPYSVHASNVSLVDPKSGGATRVGIRTDAKGIKIRFSKKSGEVIA